MVEIQNVLSTIMLKNVKVFNENIKVVCRTRNLCGNPCHMEFCYILVFGLQSNRNSKLGCFSE